MGEISRFVEEVLHSYPQNPRFLLPILQDIQRREKYLPVDAMRAVAAHLGVPDSRVYAVATFYKSLSLEKKGETEVKVCLGTACHLRGAPEVVAEFERLLGVKNGSTTSDGRYSLETVNCLGACALAPVVVIGDEVHGGVAPSAAAGLLGDRRD